MQQKTESSSTINFNLLPVVILEQGTTWDYELSQLTNVALDSDQLIVSFIGLDVDNIERIREGVQSNFIARGWNQERLEDITFIAILDNWFTKLDASSNKDKRWYSMTHIYYDIIRKRRDLLDKRFTHILWCHDPSKNNIKPLYDGCKRSYEQGEKKLLFKTKSNNDMINFCTYLPGQRFLSPDMINNNVEEDYNKVISYEV
tara:strand:+ start:154 stop:759 length:606 start_codon:yes stop_codon:yes gene_type:complete